MTPLTEMEKILAEERELEEEIRKLTELKAKLAEAKRLELRKAEEIRKEEALKKEQEKVVEIYVMKVVGGNLLCKSVFRSDLLNVWKTTPGRTFRGDGWDESFQLRVGSNLIPISEWDRTVDRILALPNTSFIWTPGVKEELDWFRNAPPWDISVHHSTRHFLAKAGPRENVRRLMNHIPGASWDEDSKSYKIPMSEGWRIFGCFDEHVGEYGVKHPKVDGVVYSDEAKEIIFKQVEDRNRLDLITKKEDSDDPRIKLLTRPVWVPEKQKWLPWHEAMRPFQRVMIEFMLATDGRMMDGDDTGLGKTWCFLAYCEIRRLTDKKDFQAICVVKAANIPNWLREIPRLTGEEPTQLISGTPSFSAIKELCQDRVPYALISYDTLGIKKEQDDIDVECENPAFDKGESHTNCYICKGTGRVKQKVDDKYPWIDIIKVAAPDALTLDEAHQIKTPTTNRSKATRMLAEVPHVIPMTASPVLNRTEELWPILYMLNPHVFKVHQQFLDTYTWGGRSPKNVKQLHDLLKPMFLRRKKGDVLKDLPPINRIIELVKIGKKAANAYEDVLQGIYTKLATFDPSGQGGDQTSVLNILSQITRLKQICSADTVEYTADLATDLIDQGSDDSKVLIFSQFKGVASAIAQRLGHEAVCTVRRTETDFISLNSSQRDELFESARNDKRVRYIVTTEAAKEGHNLEFCNWVIFNDLLWTPAAHDQCEGRAYGRLSNPHHIDSFYIVADMKIVHWINELLQAKLAIIQEAVENIENTRDDDVSMGMELIKRMKEEMWTRGG